TWRERHCEQPDGTWHGPVHRIDDAGLRFAGEMVDGRRHGTWREWDELGRLVEEAVYDSGRRHGRQLRWLHGVLIERCTWLGGVKHGTCEDWSLGHSIEHYDRGYPTGTWAHVMYGNFY